jgi:hypothetical protein
MLIVKEEDEIVKTQGARLVLQPYYCPFEMTGQGGNVAREFILTYNVMREERVLMVVVGNLYLV